MRANYSIETKRTETTPARSIHAGFGTRRERNHLRRNILATIREAELAHWQATGGDFLGRVHPALAATEQQLAVVALYKALGGGWSDEQLLARR